MLSPVSLSHIVIVWKLEQFGFTSAPLVIFENCIYHKARSNLREFSNISVNTQLHSKFIRLPLLIVADFSGVHGRKISPRHWRNSPYDKLWNVWKHSNFISQVDVYSFGLLLLEMCIREYPVPDYIADQIQHVPCPRLRGLICRCVQQVPESRPGMDEVIEILTQLIEWT